MSQDDRLCLLRGLADRLRKTFGLECFTHRSSSTVSNHPRYIIPYVRVYVPRKHFVCEILVVDDFLEAWRPDLHFKCRLADPELLGKLDRFVDDSVRLVNG